MEREASSRPVSNMTQKLARWWWHVPIITAFRRQRQGDLFTEIQASLVYKASSRTARATQRNLVSKNKNKQKVIQ